MVSLDFEQRVWQNGVAYVAGCDEAGRGPLLGSVVAAAVIMPEGLLIDGVNDSKKLTPKKREKLHSIIMERALAVGIGEVDNRLIDMINIRQASRLAMKIAIHELKDRDGKPVIPEYLLVDGETVDLETPQEKIIHGDALCHSIAAASIVAKVYRDRKCLEWEERFPGYGIAKHKGYSTREHVEALLKFGPTPLHRASFLKKIMARATVEQQELFKNEYFAEKLV
ncbi:ribonuclease HII [Desulforamulus aeronauticus]|uniref:Ribonuclease HII n=1 Tax=Desulforamulus aeronauticus DSM 10349 TaxID=1121421 RepID=A0A1M6W096_9FIRM|nr:ribonuclease HII [Desulforamulus aeronauticus]SHK87129.1 RNase HII [Desulforamulus aeronauticus DSM 10349]